MNELINDTKVVLWLEENLPTWTLQDKHLVRVFTTGNWRLTMLLANTIGFLAEAAWHHPELVSSYSKLVVRLQTHDAGGITRQDLELARQIETVATWQPERSEDKSSRPGRWVE